MEAAEEMPETPLHSSKNIPGTFSQNGCSNRHEKTREQLQRRCYSGSSPWLP